MTTWGHIPPAYDSVDFQNSRPSPLDLSAIWFYLWTPNWVHCCSMLLCRHAPHGLWGPGASCPCWCPRPARRHCWCRWRGAAPASTSRQKSLSRASPGRAASSPCCYSLTRCRCSSRDPPPGCCSKTSPPGSGRNRPTGQGRLTLCKGF